MLLAFFSPLQSVQLLHEMQSCAVSVPFFPCLMVPPLEMLARSRWYSRCSHRNWCIWCNPARCQSLPCFAQGPPVATRIVKVKLVLTLQSSQLEESMQSCRVTCQLLEKEIVCSRVETREGVRRLLLPCKSPCWSSPPAWCCRCSWSCCDNHGSLSCWSSQRCRFRRCLLWSSWSRSCPSRFVPVCFLAGKKVPIRTVTVSMDKENSNLEGFSKEANELCRLGLMRTCL